MATTSDPSTPQAGYLGDETVVDVNPTNDTDVTLTADWEEAFLPMQNFDCSSLGLNDTIKLIDKRDSKKYTVAKLKDGKCWMTQNLQIENKVLTPEDSNVITNYTLPASSQNGFSAYDTSNVYIDPTYGGYYNWYTATAGAGVQSLSTQGYNVNTSICPRGWRLPTSGNSNSDFEKLRNYYGGTASVVSANLLKPPFNLVLSGWIYEGTLRDYGTYGNFWSSTVLNSISSYRFGLNHNDFSPSTNSLKKYGVAVRCIAEDRNIHQISNMQEMSPKICENTTTPNKTSTTLDTNGSRQGDTAYVPTKTLTDTRDNNTYTVSKLADGKCWMTQNLRIAGKTLTPADSDVVNNYTIPSSSISGFSGFNISNAYIDSIYGGYYNFHAVTAGLGTYAMSTQGQNITSSICPKSWRLPTSYSSDSDFLVLYNTYNSSTLLRANPVNLTLAGLLHNSAFVVRDNTGFYASSTIFNQNDSYTLTLNNTEVNPALQHSYKMIGFSVRCVAR